MAEPRTRAPRRMLVLLVAVLCAACGEPAPDLAVPERDGGSHVLDAAGVLDERRVPERLAGLADRGLDVVALTFETPQASLGEADRAGRRLLEAWGADVVVVAVARPGDFHAVDDSRRRFFGVYPADRFTVPASVRERIADEVVPPLAAGNDWTGAFLAAIDEIDEGAG